MSSKVITITVACLNPRDVTTEPIIVQAMSNRVELTLSRLDEQTIQNKVSTYGYK